MSIKGNSITLFDDCKEVETKTLTRSDDGVLDTEGLVFVGREIESNAIFEVHQ